MSLNTGWVEKKKEMMMMKKMLRMRFSLKLEMTWKKKKRVLWRRRVNEKWHGTGARKQQLGSRGEACKRCVYYTPGKRREEKEMIWLADLDVLLEVIKWHCCWVNGWSLRWVRDQCLSEWGPGAPAGEPRLDCSPRARALLYFSFISYRSESVQNQPGL